MLYTASSMLRIPARVLSRTPWRAVRGIQTQSPSTVARQSSSARSVATHFAAAVAGGASVLLAAYGYYHYSGLASLVAKARAAKTRYVEVRSAWRENKPRTASEAVTFLRSLSRSRSGPVPDAFVDMVEQFQGDHEEDIDRIVFGACDDIQAIIAESREAGVPEAEGGIGEQGLTAEERRKISAVVQSRAGELKEKVKGRFVKIGKNDEDGSPGPVMSAAIRWRAKHRDGQKPPENEEGS